MAQRAWACERLAAAGIDASCVVIADDENLDSARELGFATVRQRNFLGMKLNDGYQWAAENGADWVMPIGSDSWVEPQWIIDGLAGNPAGGIKSRHYSVIDFRGSRRAQLLVNAPMGTHFVFPLAALDGCNYRPVPEGQGRGLDTRTCKTLAAEGVTFELSEVHELESVAFQSPRQISSYGGLFKRWGVSETTRPFDGLDDVYPVELVGRIRRHYAAFADA